MLKILLAALVLAICAASAGATTVSVRVSAIGPTSLPGTAVAIPTTAPQEDGHDSAATTAGAALGAAVGSPNWAAHWNSSFNEVVVDSVFRGGAPFCSPLFLFVLL